jgi:hypothetical protein
VGANSSRNPGKVIKTLNALVTDAKPVVSPPNTGAGVANQVCFAFCCDSTAPDKGCDNRQFNRWKKIYEPCKRHHIDLSDGTWASYDKSVFKPLWDYLQNPNVKQYIEPMDDFKAMMQ